MSATADVGPERPQPPLGIFSKPPDRAFAGPIPIERRRLSRLEAVLVGSGLGLFFLIILGIPGFGAVSGSLLGDYGSSFSLTWANYSALFQQSGLLGPLERSMVYGVITATATVFLGFIAARLLSQRRTAATGAMDYLLLASVALPGVVFGAGYIFAYNLPIMSTLHIDLYQTVQLLVIPLPTRLITVTT